jgi:Domain of unknown function (DUF4350)
MKSRPKWHIEWAWLIAVLFVILLGFSWLPGRARDKLDSYSPTPRGKSAFFALVQRYVEKTSRQERALIPSGDPDGARTLVILGPARYPTDPEWKRLHGWVARGNTVVFAARLQEPRVELKGFGLRIVPARPLGLGVKKKIAEVLLSKPGEDEMPASKDTDKDADKNAPKKKKGAGASLDAKVRTSPLERKIKTKLVVGDVRWFSAGRIKIDPSVKSRVRVLVESDSGDQAVVAAVGKGRIVVVASDEIFVNQSHLLGGDHPVLAYRLFEQRGGSGAVVFDEYLNITGTPKVFGLLFEAMLRPITLQLLLVAALFGWWGSRRFGPPLPPSNAPRRSMVEHAEALGNLHFRAGTGGRAVAAYLEYWRAEMHLGGAASSQQQQIAVIARRAGRLPEDVTQLLRMAAAAAQQTQVPAAQASLIIRELSGLKQKTHSNARGTHGNR